MAADPLKLGIAGIGVVGAAGASRGLLAAQVLPVSESKGGDSKFGLQRKRFNASRRDKSNFAIRHANGTTIDTFPA